MLAAIVIGRTRREVCYSAAMPNRTLLLAKDVHDYVLRCASREPEVLARLRDATAAVPENAMQIGPDQGQLMALLVKLIGAKSCIDIGTYTGYSALAVALALPEDGRLITCDVKAEWAAVGQAFWREAGMDARIELRIQPALDTLAALLEDGEAGRFDFAFIDADKPSYVDYYEKLLELIRPGGLIAVDNTLALAGAPIVSQDSTSANAMRAFNDYVHHDERVDLALLTVGEGLTLLRVR
jgi:predicted O-methyltransferase YrrM